MRIPILAALCAVLGSAPLPAQGRDAIDHATVPMSVEGNAPIVTLRFKRPDGAFRAARFLFDSGGGAIIVDEGLARDLELVPKGPELSESNQRYRQVDLPPGWIGQMSIDLRAAKAFMHLGKASFTNRDAVEGMVPGKAFVHYQVVLDYLRQEMSIGDAGTLPHRGERILAPFLVSSGHPRVEATIGGETHGFLLDTGTQLTLVREDLLQKWSKGHSDWPRSIGAVGPANVDGAADDAFLLRAPILRIGSFGVVQVAMASRPDETYSATNFETPEAIVGAIGGNVLSQFRLEIDYPDQLVFLERSRQVQETDFQTVGLVLDTDIYGNLVVRAVSSAASAITRQNVLPGDVILQIGSRGKAPYTLTMAHRALSGAPGEKKELHILRKDAPLTVIATVSQIL